VKCVDRHFRGFTTGGGRLGSVVEGTVGTVIVPGGSSDMAIANALRGFSITPEVSAMSIGC